VSAPVAKAHASAELQQRSKTEQRAAGALAGANPLWLRLATGAQAKLAVSRPDDPLERQADQIADRVLRMSTPRVQSACAASGAGAQCPDAPEDMSVQRQAGGMADAASRGRSSAQPNANPPAVSRTPVAVYRQETFDVELAPASPAELESARESGIDLPSVSGETWRALGGTPYPAILPGYSQEGDSCGAASLVSALVIWDREHWDATQPNNRVVSACNLVLIEIARNGEAAVRRWAERPAGPIRDICGTDRDCAEMGYGLVRDRFVNDLESMRDRARAPGAMFPEVDYQQLGLALYFLWDQTPGRGLSSTEIERIQRSLGLQTLDSGNVQSFDEIFTHSITTSLAADEFAQVLWIVRTGQQHAFLIGRLQSGGWILSDQGPSPAVEFRASSLADLRSAVRLSADSGQYWLFTGTTQQFIERVGTLPGWTGVKRLGPHTATPEAAHDIVAPDAFLGEVDAGWTTIGSTLNRRAFVAQVYSLAGAQAALPAGDEGGLIVELPRGVFTVYTTTSVSDANLSQTALDASDSSGGVLAGRSVLHAWLILSTSAGRRGTWFPVF
jgi:hypothetical protein